MSKIKISVITVVWNDAKGLEKTIQSVINQTYKNIEFIVIDGGSTDGTVDVIKKYEEYIDYWVTEKDNGIYDAMNKGILAATGMWINFMNAGDTFANENAIKNIKFHDYKNYMLIYGKKIQNGQIINPLPIERLRVGDMHANHQSMFFNKNLLQGELIYDLRYKIYGDYELVNKIYVSYFKQIIFIDTLITDFEGGGISSVVSTQKRKDKYNIVFKYYGVFGIINSIIYRIKKGVNL